jgi:predicted MFS family arabinose efflux permease
MKVHYFLGLQETVYSFGYDVGSTLLGVLFHALGTQVTLLIYSISTAALLISLLLYTQFSKHDRDYKELAQHDDNEVD